MNTLQISGQFLSETKVSEYLIAVNKMIEVKN